MTTETFFFDPKALDALARQLHPGYVSATPFPHVVLDDFVPETVLDRVAAEFPGPDEIPWAQHRDEHSQKLACSDESHMGAATRHLLAQLNSATFVNFLETLTGIDGLVPDPHFFGGGLHQIERGGYLRIHADFNFYPKLRLERRLNLLLFLNRGWDDGYGGHLELWKRDMTACARKLAPVFNRCVVFSTTDTAFHGHPDPLRCPEGTTRRSLAVYYYSAERPEGERSAAHSTLYRARPGERAGGGGRRELAKRFVPPVLLDLVRSLRGRRD